jgi:nucleoredoxin
MRLIRTTLSILIFSLVTADSFGKSETNLKFEDFISSDVIYDSTGKKISVESMSSKYKLIYFTASWCGPCKKITKIIQSKSMENSDELVVIVISYDSGQKLADYMSDKIGWNYVKYDKSRVSKLNKLANTRNVASIPTRIMFSPTNESVSVGEQYSKFKI